MAAIYKREVNAFFHSFIGWLYFAVMFLVMGVYFTFYNMMNGYPNLSPVLQGGVLIFLFTVPVLTMRSLSEERRQRTDQMILTAPVSVGGIVVGKYLALVTVFSIPVVLIALTPIMLSFFGAFQVGVSYTALFGFFLYGALSLAIGLFISSLTESIVISAVLTFIVLLLGYLMSWLCSIVSPTGNVLTKILSAFDVFGRFYELLVGSFYIPAVTYFLSLILFILFCTTQSIQKRRYHVSGKGLKIGTYSLGMVVVTAILTIVVNIAVNHLPENVISLDVTSNKLYTLTKETKEYVSGLADDITIYVLVNEEYKDSNLDTTLRKLADLSPHIRLNYVDPTLNPRFYAGYTDIEPSENSLIVEGPARSRVIDYDDIYEYEYYSYYEYQITGYDGEGQIVSALSYVTTDEMPKIYVIDGHEELALEGDFIRAIQKDNIEYETLSLLAIDAVPEDAQTVILNAPLRDYSEDEADKIIAYLENGGNAVIIPAWTDEELPNFNKVLAYYGVSLTDGIILEDDMSNYYGDIPYLTFPQINYDEITDSVYGMAVFAPYAKGILYQDGTEGMYYTPLLESGTDSYCKVFQNVDSQVITDFSKEQGDEEGPFVIALKAEKYLGNDVVSNAVIVASELFFTEDADSIVPGNQVKLFGSIIGALTEHESSIVIPLKYYSEALTFSSRAAAVVGIFCILLLPIFSLVNGFVIWWGRRKR